MKKVLILLAFSSMVLWAGDANTMRVYSASGSSLDIKLTDVDSVLFTTPDSLQLFKANVKMATLPLLGVDSIGFVYTFSYGTLTDNRDGQVYRTVKIGTQTWMAQNLNYKPDTGNSWCYGNDTTNCKTYRRLYDWGTAMGFGRSTYGEDMSTQIQPIHQGICPTGWHVPTDDEWKTLEMFAGLTQAEADGTGWRWRGSIGTQLKSATNWDGTDDFGFSALPAGYRYGIGLFDISSFYANFWSASQSGQGSAWGRGLNGGDAGVARYNVSKDNAFSLRCLQD